MKDKLYRIWYQNMNNLHRYDTKPLTYDEAKKFIENQMVTNKFVLAINQVGTNIYHHESEFEPNYRI